MSWGGPKYDKLCEQHTAAQRALIRKVEALLERPLDTDEEIALDNLLRDCEDAAFEKRHFEIT